MRIEHVLFVFTLSAFQAVAQNAPSSPNEVERLNTDASEDPVQPETLGNVYATGLIYARPTRGKKDTGTIYKSDESHLIVGNFQDDTKYSGNTIDVSTKSRKVFMAVDDLDQNKHYVFSYWTPYPFHWQMTDTDIELNGYTDSKESTDFLSAKLPYSMNVANGKTGTYTRDAETVGRIVQIFRWNTYFLGRAICSFDLDQGGSKRASNGPVANEVTFNVYSETGCKYIESILPYGLEVKVRYDVAYLTIDGNDNFLKEIVVTKIPGLNNQKVVSDSVSKEERSLLEDPNFQKELEQLVTKYWEKNHAPSQPPPK